MGYVLNQKQKAYRENFIITFAKAEITEANTSRFCYCCGSEGDCRDPNGSFDAIIPWINPKQHSRGLLMDAIRGVWNCPNCTVQMKTKK